MVGARELTEEPPVDVGFSLMWCFILEGVHRMPVDCSHFHFYTQPSRGPTQKTPGLHKFLKI